MLLKKWIVIAALLAANTACAQQAKPVSTGKVIFERKCSPCHGKSGAKGLFGAKDLRKSVLSDSDLAHVIANGRKVMPAWQSRLNAAQIAEVVGYIKTLRG